MGRHAFIGSYTVIVSPVHVADGTYVAAGSAIVNDVEPGRSPSPAAASATSTAGWIARSGTATAAAAEARARHPHETEQQPSAPEKDDQ